MSFLSPLPAFPGPLGKAVTVRPTHCPPQGQTSRPLLPCHLNVSSAFLLSGMSPDKGKSLQITALKASSAHVKIDTLAPLATLPGRMSPDKGPRMLPSLRADNVLTSRNEYAGGSTHYRESGAGGGRGGGAFSVGWSEQETEGSRRFWSL